MPPRRTVEMPAGLSITDPRTLNRIAAYALQLGAPKQRAFEALVEHALDVAGAPASHLRVGEPDATPRAIDKHAAALAKLLIIAPDGLTAAEIGRHFSWSTCTTSRAIAQALADGLIVREQVNLGRRGPHPFVHKIAPAGAP